MTFEPAGGPSRRFSRWNESTQQKTDDPELALRFATKEKTHKMSEHSEAINWANFESSYVKWDNPGRIVQGTVTKAYVGSYKGKQYPEFVLDTADGERIISASQAHLLRQLATERPTAGDELTVEYTGDGPVVVPGQNPMKVFRVEVKRPANAGNGPEAEPYDDAF